MRKILVLAAALAAAIAFACPAVAQTLSNYTLIDSAQHNFKVAVYQNPTTTFIAPASVSADSAGNPLSGTIGISNPNGTALYVQGVTNGVPLLTSFSAPQHVICDSGCGGGGGGGGAVFGPTAVGTANANPPVMIGGTADGTATGAVGILKVLGGSAFINCANCSGSGISVAFGGAIGSVGTPSGFKDGSGNFQPLLGDTNGEWVNIKASVAIPVTGTFFQTTQPVSLTSTTITGSVAVTGTFFQATQPVSGTVTANAGTNLNTSLLALEGGGNLASINTKTPALGQALAASSVPVVLTALQLSALTPPAAITNFAQETGGNLATIATNTGRIPAQGQALAAASLPVVLTALQITALTPPTTVTVQQPTGTNLHIVCDSGCSGSGGTSSTFGAAFPAAGTAIGMSQGGNMVALNGTAGNLLVSCANCSGSGASAVDEATITFGTSVFAPMGGAYQTTATSNPLVSGQQGMAQLTINRAVHMNLRNSTGVEVGVAATPLQVSLANTGANGTALAVTLASTTVTGTVAVTQSTSPWIVAGGGTAGTPGTAVLTIQGVASGTNVPTSHASGSVASGAYASGSIAAGAMVDITNVSTPISPNTATATKALAIGGQFNTTQETLTTGQQAGVALSVRGAVFVATGADTFNVTVNSALPAGTNLMGKVGIDQTTVGTTNGVSIAQIGATTVATGNGTSGAGNLRVNIASDNTAFAVNATLQASSATAIGTVNPTTIGTWGLQVSTQNSATPTNMALMAGQFNTAPTTITTGNISALQLDNAGNLLVNIKAGASSGAVAQGSTTSGQTGGLIQAAALASAPTYTTATTNPLTMTLGGSLHTTVDNSNANGSAVSASSSPVVIASDQAAVAVKGNAANGSAVSGNPNLICGSDGTNCRTISTDATGAVKQAGTENHVGEVGSNQIEIPVAPTVTASAYTAGNAVGGLQTLANTARVSGTNGASGTGGILAKMAMTVKTVQSTQFDVFFFNANPSGSTCTDHAAFVLAAADAAKVIGVLTIPSTPANGGGWFSGGTGSVGMATPYPISFSLGSATSLFACAVARGTPTFGSTSDVAFNYNVLRD